jgi:hypothetical protein
MLYRKTLPHHGRTFYGSLQLSRLFQKMHAFGRQMFPCVPRFSAWGVRERVLYHFTPGIPFDRNLFAALGMIPSAILCALFLLMPYGGWIPALICAFAGALFAPATAALKGLDFGLIPTMLWGFMAGMTAYPGVVLPQAAQPEDEPAG